MIGRLGGCRKLIIAYFALIITQNQFAYAQVCPEVVDDCPYSTLDVFGNNNTVGINVPDKIFDTSNQSVGVPACVGQMIRAAIDRCNSSFDANIDAFIKANLAGAPGYFSRFCRAQIRAKKGKWYRKPYNLCFDFYSSEFTKSLQELKVGRYLVDECVADWAIGLFGGNYRSNGLNRIGFNQLGFTPGPWAKRAKRSSAHYTYNSYNPVGFANGDTGSIVTSAVGFAPGLMSIMYKKGRILLDSQCRAVPSIPLNAQACYAGKIDWAICPLSLIWDKEADLEKDIRVVQFPLNPADGKGWTLWKASAKAPLLVYDPLHQGKITSAYQLFGNWALGGKRLSLDSGNANLTSSANTKWANGYEALAELDENKDKKISGAELEPLALWFDHDRDGVSQPGEVKPIRELNVTSLFYNMPKHESSTGSLILSKGYERELNGKIQSGESVDWVVDTASTKDELLTRYLKSPLATDIKVDTKSIFNPEKPHAGRLSIPINSILRTGGSKMPTNIHNLSGFWSWRSMDSRFTAEYPEGYFSFADMNTELLNGHVYSAISLGKNPTQAVAMLSTHSFQGRKTLHDGRVELEFTVELEDGGKVSSSGTLASDGQTIHGQSTAFLKYNQKKPFSITYDWVARKIANKF